MPLENNPYNDGRYTFWKNISDDDIERFLRDEKAYVLQTNTEAPQETWERINAFILSKRPEIQNLLWKFDDLAPLSNLQHLAVDCLDRVANIESLERFPKK